MTTAISVATQAASESSRNWFIAQKQVSLLLFSQHFLQGSSLGLTRFVKLLETILLCFCQCSRVSQRRPGSSRTIVISPRTLIAETKVQRTWRMLHTRHILLGEVLFDYQRQMCRCIVVKSNQLFHGHPPDVSFSLQP
jgi:hypothetical protein